MPGRNHLFVPGPTNVPDRVLRAMHVAMEDHRSSKFPELATQLLRDLKKVFRTESGQPFIFPATGTGGWEAALANTRSPGDKMLACRYGQFSHLWIDLATRIGLDVEVMDVEWGEGAPPDKIQARLAADTGHTIKGVMIVHNETATGVTSDVGAVRRAIDAARHPALLYVDSVSGLGSIDFRFDEWGVDLAVTGSQKGLMLPAGLGIVCASTEGAGPARVGEMRPRLLRLRRHDQGQRHRLLPLHADAADAVRLARGAGHPLRGGARQRVRPPSPAGRRHAARGQGVGPGALCQGAASGTPTP